MISIFFLISIWNYLLNEPVSIYGNFSEIKIKEKHVPETGGRGRGQMQMPSGEESSNDGTFIY